jgi:hypothetical protein
MDRLQHRAQRQIFLVAVLWDWQHPHLCRLLFSLGCRVITRAQRGYVSKALTVARLQLVSAFQQKSIFRQRR